MVRRESPCSIASGALILCAATPAETVYLKDMGHHLPNDLIVDLFFKVFHQADMQINDLAAGKTDEMVVMIAVRTEIVVELPVRMDDLADYPSSRKCSPKQSAGNFGRQLDQVESGGFAPKFSPILPRMLGYNYVLPRCRGG